MLKKLFGIDKLLEEKKRLEGEMESLKEEIVKTSEEKRKETREVEYIKNKQERYKNDTLRTEEDIKRYEGYKDFFHTYIKENGYLDLWDIKEKHEKEIAKLKKDKEEIVESLANLGSFKGIKQILMNNAGQPDNNYRVKESEMTEEMMVVEEIYKERWEDIIEKDGVINFEQVKLELANLSFLLKQVPIVYSMIGGFTKPNYNARVIVKAHDERYYDKWFTREDVLSILEDCSDFEGLKESLTDLFKLSDHQRDLFDYNQSLEVRPDSPEAEAGIMNYQKSKQTN